MGFSSKGLPCLGDSRNSLQFLFFKYYFNCKFPLYILKILYNSSDGTDRKNMQNTNVLYTMRILIMTLSVKLSSPFLRILRSRVKERKNRRQLFRFLSLVLRFFRGIVSASRRTPAASPVRRIYYTSRIKRFPFHNQQK